MIYNPYLLYEIRSRAFKIIIFKRMGKFHLTKDEEQVIFNKIKELHLGKKTELATVQNFGRYLTVHLK